MKKRFMSARMAAIGVVLSLVVISTASATHVFDDVADNKFFAGPVEWALDNGITTGTSPSTFEPDRGVSRGESVTFLKRYNDNIVQPALKELEDASGRVSFTNLFVDIDDWDGSLLADIADITVPTAGFLVISYAVNFERDFDETGSGRDRYIADVWVDGASSGALVPAAIDFDLTDTDFGSQTVAVHVVVEVAAGAHTVTGFISREDGTSATNLAYVHNTSISAIFVPLDATGMAAAPFMAPDVGNSGGQSRSGGGSPNGIAARQAAVG
jgi:hypothetical protein